ncbi:hypothetical protein ACGVWS_11855 [Enterobacteriaceae bacterium LUAb1]
MTAEQHIIRFIRGKGCAYSNDIHKHMIGHGYVRKTSQRKISLLTDTGRISHSGNGPHRKYWISSSENKDDDSVFNIYRNSSSINYEFTQRIRGIREVING